MSRAYRTVFFLPDPALDWKIPIAALISERGEIRVGMARLLPDDACVGGSARMSLLRRGLDALSHAVQFDQLPLSLGPHFVAGTPRELHVDVDDALAWVVESVLPAPIDPRTQGTRGPTRGTIGYRFFERRHVQDYVKKTYHPAERLHVNGAVSRLDPVSHWVAGERKLMLMEPVITGRREWEQDVKNVVRTFYSYRAAVIPSLYEQRIEPELVVYLVGGGSKHARQEARKVTHGVADRIWDVNDDVQADHFVAEITAVGKTEPPQRQLL